MAKQRLVWAGGDAVRVTPDGQVTGYVFIWGTQEKRDAYDTWFDQSRPPQYSYTGDMRNIPLAYEHGVDKQVGKAFIGAIESAEFDAVGLRFEGQLDKTHPDFPRFISEASQGKLKTSSGAIAHLVEFREDGSFDKWPIGEVSLTQRPAEKRMPSISMIRSIADEGRDALGEDDTDDEDVSNQQENPEMPDNVGNEQIPQTNAPLTREEIMALIEQVSKRSAQQEAPANNPAQLKVEDELKAIRTLLSAPPADPKSVQNSPKAPALSTQVFEQRLYQGRSLEELAVSYEVTKSVGKTPSQPLLQVIAGRSEDAIKKNDPIFDYDLRTALRGATRSDEIVTSTNSGNGDEWVGVAYSNRIWERVRAQPVIASLLAKGMMVEESGLNGSETVYFPIEGTDPVSYSIPTQSGDLDATARPPVAITASPITTATVALTPGRIAASAVYTDEFVEDSFVAGSRQIAYQLSQSLVESAEKLVLNGDTTTSTANINYNSSSVPSSPHYPYYNASNGLLYYALVTGTTATSFDAGSLDDADYLAALALMPADIQARISNLLFIADPATHTKSLGITAVKTMDVRGNAATIVSGRITNIYGIDMAVTGHMLKAYTDGKVHSTAGNNTKGRFLLTYAPYVGMGWKRRITLETQRFASAFATQIVGSMRLGFAMRGSGAAVCAYNITV